MTRRVNEVDEKSIAILLLRDVGQISVREFIVERDSAVLWACARKKGGPVIQTLQTVF